MDAAALDVATRLGCGIGRDREANCFLEEDNEGYVDGIRLKFGRVGRATGPCDIMGLMLALGADSVGEDGDELEVGECLRRYDEIAGAGAIKRGLSFGRGFMSPLMRWVRRLLVPI